MMPWMHGWYGYGPPGGLGWSLWAWIHPLLLLGLLILGVYLVVRALTPRREDRALEILRERYARGEIDKETFERMKRDLS
ncbi:SHOCT domain-containing protein [Thermus thermamylovorans]|uniref:SHOCT domain-containing protein n=1 Tax=Thermus thermamylovorans TaxID=2509362 RepID=A0A4Q9B4E3_9DEIN|nr:SHOCT domain-containing protein [Thermus thermamylovorans]TBH20507.1 SHOCT domain-containing protein [Thermus thermamylovorans]